MYVHIYEYFNLMQILDRILYKRVMSRVAILKNVIDK